MPSLSPPDDESIKTLYVGGLDAQITEQDLRDHFYAHGEIESIRMVSQRACAFVSYTNRERAEKAAEELSNKLVIKGLRLKLMWGKPQVPKTELEVPDDEAAHQGAVAHGGLLPRAVISQQQSGQQAQPPETHEHNNQQTPMHYFNIPLPFPSERTFYPSMDPQRMGAAVPPSSSQESNDGKAGSDRQTRGAEGSSQIYPGPHPHIHHGQYPPYYPPYAYMAPPPPHYQHQQYRPYQQMMVPPPPPPPVPHQPQPSATPQHRNAGAAASSSQS